MRGDLSEKIFILTMWWKVIYGVIRIWVGLSALKLVGTPLLDVVTKVMRRELVEDPNDVIFNFITYWLNGHAVYVTYFLAIYLIFWGVTDIVLSYNLIKHKLWAFPVTIVLIFGFICYEIFRYFHTHSLFLLGLIIFDAFVMWLIWKEYEKLKLHIKFKKIG